MVSDFLNASPNELVRRYGAVKKDNIYEVPLQNAPWVFYRSFPASLSPGYIYALEGIEASWTGPGEVYVVLTDWEVGVGFAMARRRRMFRCIRRPYAAPYGIRLPQHLRVKPVELLLSDSDVISCVERPLEAKALAVLPATYSTLNTLKVRLDGATLREAGRAL